METIAFIVALLMALVLHEIAHGLVAYWNGDITAKYYGRLSLNPAKHFDIIGLIMMLFVGFGWAKPVAINQNNFRNRKEGVIKVSLAGPASNLFACFLAAFMAALLNKFGMMGDGMYKFLLWMQLYNVWFAFFNLLPIPPLDGSKLVSEMLPPYQAWKFENFVGQYGMYILFGLVLTGAMGWILNPLARMYLFLVNSILGIVF